MVIESSRPYLRCSAHSSRTGEPCKRWAITGATVCATHGGQSPQVKRSAAERIAERIQTLADPAVTVLQELMRSDDERIRIVAARDVLDRGGFKAPDRQELSGPGGGPVQTEDVSKLTDDERAERIRMILNRVAARGGTAGGGNEV